MASLLGDLLCFSRSRVAFIGVSIFSALVITGFSRDRQNEVSFGFASGFGIKASFQNPAMPNPIFPGTPSRVSGRTIYKYNDGHVDGAGNSGASWVRTYNSTERTYNGTWDWAYDEAAQHVGNGVVVLTHNQSTLTDNTMQRDRAGYVPGIQLGYRREIRSDESVSLGFLTGMEMHRIKINSRDVFKGTYYQTKDYYLLENAADLPGAPYVGSSGGANISNLYGRRDVTTGYVDTYRDNAIEGNLFVLQAGMDFRYYMEDNMSLQVAIGIIYAPFFYDYDFRDTLQIAQNSPEIEYAAGSTSESEGIFGSFFNVKWAFAFNDNWGGYIGVRHMHMDKVKLEYEEDRWTELNFRNSIFVDTGVTYIW